MQLALDLPRVYPWLTVLGQDVMHDGSQDDDGQHSRLIAQTRAHRWQKGQSGNPKGKAVVKTLQRAYLDVLDEICPGSGLTYAQAIARKTAQLAAKGNISAIKEIGDRVLGAARQSLTVAREEPDAGQIAGIIHRITDGRRAAEPPDINAMPSSSDVAQ